MSTAYGYTTRGRPAQVPASPPPYYYSDPSTNQPGANNAFHPTAQTPLLAHANSSVQQRKTSFNGTMWLVGLGMMILMVINLTAMFTQSPDDGLDPAVRNRMRREWAKEMSAHEEIRRAWSVEIVDHESLRVGWEHERKEIISMREQLVRDKEQWAKDREEEKREEERRRDEEEDRVRAGFAWADLQADQRCLRYGTRLYSARITNVPREYDPVKACTETAVNINGLEISRPYQCEDKGCDNVFGHWIVDHSEPTCVTRFDQFKDKGCTSPGSGRRRIEAPLENLQPNDNWRDMCSTTPADFLHLHFDSPTVCEHWGKYGAWGIWMIEDQQC